MKKYETPQIEVVKFETEAILNGSSGGNIPVDPTPAPTDAPPTVDDQGPWG